MRLSLLLATGACLAALPAWAQRPVRFGPVISGISLEDGNGTGHSYSSYGGTLAFLTGDDAEAGATVARYNNLSSTACARQLTFIGLDSYYYPVGAKGVAPYANTELGLARVTEAQAPLLFSCTASTPVQTSNQLGLAFGLGVRVTVDQAIAMVEGRFVQVPNSFVQGLELRGNVSVAFGAPRKTELLKGTVGPAISWWVPISGPFEARAPLVGVRFERDTKKKSGTLGLQIDYAPLRVRGSCTPPGGGCEPGAILFAPGYELSAYPRWGRGYVEVGLLLAGFYSQGPDRGIAQGAHGGLGVDVFSGAATMVNFNTRLTWLQRSSGANNFAVQVGVSLSPRLEHAATR